MPTLCPATIVSSMHIPGHNNAIWWGLVNHKNLKHAFDNEISISSQAPTRDYGEDRWRYTIRVDVQRAIVRWDRMSGALFDRSKPGPAADSDLLDKRLLYMIWSSHVTKYQSTMKPLKFLRMSLKEARRSGWVYSSSWQITAILEHQRGWPKMNIKHTLLFDYAKGGTISHLSHQASLVRIVASIFTIRAMTPQSYDVSLFLWCVILSCAHPPVDIWRKSRIKSGQLSRWTCEPGDTRHTYLSQLSKINISSILWFATVTELWDPVHVGKGTVWKGSILQSPGVGHR